MYNIKLIFCFAFLMSLLSQETLGQSTYLKVFEHEGPRSAIAINALDSIPILGGNVWDKDTTNHQSVFIASIRKDTLKVENIIPKYWEPNRRYYGGYGSNLIEWNNRYLHAGSIKDDNGIGGILHIYKMNFEKDTFIEYERAQSFQLLNVAKGADGGLLLLGHSSIIDGDGNIVVHKLDSNLEIQWRQEYGGASIEFPDFLTPLRDSNFVFGGSTRSFGKTPVPNALRVLTYNAMVNCTNLEGDSLWSYVFEGKNGLGVAEAIQHPNGDIYLFGHKYREDDTTSIKFGESKFFVARMSPQGELIWQKFYPNYYSYNGTLTSASLMPNGNMVFAGFKAIGKRLDPPVGVLGSVNENGDLLWLKRYYNDTVNEDVFQFLSVSVSTDNYIYACGQNQALLPGSRQSIIVLKTDSNGCIEGVECEDISWRETAIEEEIAQEEFMVYPNPSTSNLNVSGGEFSYLIIYNLNGQVIHQQKGNSEIDVSGWKSGMYFIVITDLEGESHSLKFSVQH